MPLRQSASVRRSGAADRGSRGSPDRWTAIDASRTSAAGTGPSGSRSPKVVEGSISPRSRASAYSKPVTPLETDPISKSASSVAPSEADDVPAPPSVTIATAATGWWGAEPRTEPVGERSVAVRSRIGAGPRASAHA